MENVLRIRLKKDIFNEVSENNLRDIELEIKQFWISRLLTNNKTTVEDVLSGNIEYKDFDIVEFSCNELRLNFYLKNIDVVDNNFVIRLGDEYVEEHITSETKETEIEEQDLTTKYESETEIQEPENTNVTEEEKPIDVVENVSTQTEINKNFKNCVQPSVDEVLEHFISCNNVYDVKIPIVTIRSNGTILGCDRKISVFTDKDIRFSFDNIKIINNVTVLKWVLSKYENKKYIFICKNESGYRKDKNGNEYIKLKITAKNKI